MSNPAIHPARRDGFDVILGNPPWERVKLQDQEFFAQRDPAVAGAPNAAARKKAIAALEESNPALLKEFEAATRRADGESHLMRSSGRYPLCGRGDINTYAVFAESMRDSLAELGRLGVIVPTGIAVDDTYKKFFESIVDAESLISLLAFYQIRLIFQGTDTKDSCCLLTLCGRGMTLGAAEVAFDLRTVEELSDKGRRFHLLADDIRLLNPNTITCPVFASRRDASITKAIYRRVPVLIRESRAGASESNQWCLTFMAMFHMASDSGLFNSPEIACPAVLESFEANPKAAPQYLPLYEAKMLHQFDHRWATYARDGYGWLETPILTKTNKDGKPEPDTRELTSGEGGEKGKPAALVAPRYWVAAQEVDARLVKRQRDQETGELVEVWRWKRPWFIGWRDITYAGNERTLISAVVPRTAVGHTAPIMLPEVSATAAAGLYGLLSSFVVDYCVRQKVRGSHITYGYLMQFPVLPPSALAGMSPWDSTSMLSNWIAPRVLELVYTAHDLAGFAHDLGYDGPPFRWDPARRAQIRAELDAAFFHLYGVNRDDAAYVLDTFTVFKTRDEERNGGVYRTKETILAIYDEMARAIAGSAVWSSALSPLPGDPAAAHTSESLAAAGKHVAKSPTIQAPAIHGGEAADQQAAVIAAFLDVRQGRSPDYVVCEPDLNAAFVAAARDRGAVADAAVLNRMLLGARKTGVLSDHPTTAEYRMPKALMPYAFVAEWAARHLQRQELMRHDEPPSLDDILCDPSLAVQFDELASRIKPGIKPLDIRWAALGFRKTARKAAAPGSVTVEPTERVDADAGLSQLPEKPGLYLIVAGQQVLYANYTRDLRDQLTRHAEVASGALAPEWLLPKQSRPDTVRWAWFQSLTPEAVAEARIHLVTEHRPWLNLLETGAA